MCPVTLKPSVMRTNGDLYYALDHVMHRSIYQCESGLADDLEEIGNALSISWAVQGATLAAVAYTPNIASPDIAARLI